MPALVWDYFNKIDPSSARCKQCNAVVKTSGNTSNLRAHISNKHPALSEILFSGNNKATQPHIGTQLSEIASIKGGTRKEMLQKALVWFLAKNFHPFNIVESPQFISMVKILSPHINVPSRKTLMKYASEIFQNKKDLLKMHLQSVGWFSFTCDIWTDTSNSRSYLGLTCHFIDNYTPQSVCLSVKHITEAHTADNLCKSIREIMAEYELSNDNLISIVTDGAANITSAAKKITYKTIWCVAHRLNLVVCDAIKTYSEIEELIARVRSIVKLSKQSNNFSNMIERVQIDDSATILKLLQDVPTHWNSTYIMLERFIKMINYVKMALIKSKKEAMEIPFDKVAILKDIRILLQPFYEVTLDISGEKYVTISRVIPVINNLNHLLTTTDVQTPLGELFKRALTKEMQARFENVENSKIFAYSTIVDPRFKKIDFLSTSACAKAICDLNNLIRTVPLTQINEPPVIYEGLWSLHEKRAQILVDETGALGIGLKHYLASQTLPLNADPLDYWKKNKESKHSLHNVALQYLCSPATSVPCERLFSKSGNIISEKRTRLKPKNVEISCFLSSLPDCFIY